MDFQTLKSSYEILTKQLDGTEITSLECVECCCNFAYLRLLQGAFS